VELCQVLGIERCNFQALDTLGGGWNCGAVMLAAMAVHSGVCRNVLVYRAANGRSEVRSLRQTGAGRPAAGARYAEPFGSNRAVATFGHIATAHMARFGTTNEDFGHVAITQRKHAALNTKAILRDPITLEDHQKSPWVVYPYRVLDCCLESDNACAVVVSSAAQARDGRHAPVYIMAGTGGNSASGALWETNGVQAAAALYDGAGISVKDVDFAELYDPFTFMCMIHMEDFGLVPRGEAGPWVRAGKHGLDGEMPVNTHGGLLSEAYVHGLNHVVEAVQQLRPGGVIDDLCDGAHRFDRSTCRQLKKANIGLVCGEFGASSMLLRAA
jgi:acetyl-CoA acetyltransferase